LAGTCIIQPSHWPTCIPANQFNTFDLRRYAEGARQFRQDVAVNPNDTEEAIWAFMCEARTAGFDAARRNILVVGRDPRGYMREAYRLFDGAGSEEELRAVAANGPADEFYSLLYVGLWREARGEAEAAREAMVAAVVGRYNLYSLKPPAGFNPCEACEVKTPLSNFASKWANLCRYTVGSAYGQRSGGAVQVRTTLTRSA
jgi:hypothetical protein